MQVVYCVLEMHLVIRDHSQLSLFSILYSLFCFPLCILPWHIVIQSDCFFSGYLGQDGWAGAGCRGQPWEGTDTGHALTDTHFQSVLHTERSHHQSDHWTRDLHAIITLGQTDTCEMFHCRRWKLASRNISPPTWDSYLRSQKEDKSWIKRTYDHSTLLHCYSSYAVCFYDFFFFPLPVLLECFFSGYTQDADV